MNSKKTFFIVCYLICALSILSQKQAVDSTPVSTRMIQQSNSLNSAATKLSKSLDKGVNDEQLIGEYEQLAYEFSSNANFSKAEEYLNRAVGRASEKKMKDKQAVLHREIAEVQEEQHKINSAISNYEKAADHSRKKAQKELNINDAQRLRNLNDLHSQAKYIQKNIDLLDKKDVAIPAEKAQAYKRMAETNVQLNQKEIAIKNYEKAVETVKEEKNPKEVQKLKSEIANLYIEEQEYSKAKDISAEIFTDAQQESDVQGQLEQLKTLSEVYKNTNEEHKVKEVLMDAYSIALENKHTIDAKNSISSLAEEYRKEGNLKKSNDLYQDFLSNLDALLEADSSLLDYKILESTEEKILQLEKERALKDELIEKKNKLNYVLIISFILAVIMLIFIIRAFLSIKKRNKQIALQSLRREMNPHFIFNSLNSVNQFIAQDNELEANKYLTSYSRLMRTIMENSNKDFIKLEKEIEQLKEYLDLEHLRFPDKFDYGIEIDNHIDTETTFIPNMIIQPNLENAIWHGLRYRQTKGFLSLSFKTYSDKIQVIIKDDGIGLEASKTMKTKNQKLHKSRGLKNITERIKLLNELYHTCIVFSMEEKKIPETGVIVTITFPGRNTN